MRSHLIGPNCSTLDLSMQQDMTIHVSYYTMWIWCRWGKFWLQFRVFDVNSKNYFNADWAIFMPVRSSRDTCVQHWINFDSIYHIKVCLAEPLPFKGLIMFVSTGCRTCSMDGVRLRPLFKNIFCSLMNFICRWWRRWFVWKTES